MNLEEKFTRSRPERFLQPRRTIATAAEDHQETGAASIILKALMDDEQGLAATLHPPAGGRASLSAVPRGGGASPGQAAQGDGAKAAAPGSISTKQTAKVLNRRPEKAFQEGPRQFFRRGGSVCWTALAMVRRAERQVAGAGRG